MKNDLYWAVRLSSLTNPTVCQRMVGAYDDQLTTVPNFQELQLRNSCNTVLDAIKNALSFDGESFQSSLGLTKIVHYAILTHQPSTYRAMLEEMMNSHMMIMMVMR